MKCNCSCVFDWTGLDYKWIPQLLRFHRDIKHTCYVMPVCPKSHDMYIVRIIQIHKIWGEK